MNNPVVRLTWQASERNKFAAYMDRALRLRGHAMGSLTDPRTASVIWNTPTFAHRLDQVDLDRCRRSCCSRPASRSTASATTTCISPASSPSAAPMPGIATSRKNDTSTGLLWNASSAQLGNYPDRYNFQGALVVRHRRAQRQGRRVVSVGLRTAATTTPTPISTRPTTTASPSQVTVLNTPLDGAGKPRRQLRHLRAGLVEPQQADRQLRPALRPQQADHRRPERACRAASPTSPAYDDIEFPTWKDFSPRLSAIYDISGDGKTAIRAGFNKFVTAQTTGLRAALQPDGADHRRCCRGPTSTATTSPRASAAAPS